MPDRIRAQVTGALGVACVLGIWQLLAATDVAGDDALPTATATFSALGELTGDELFWRSLLDTLQAAVGGFLIAVALGVPLGALIGLSPLVDRSTSVVVEFLKPIPPVVLIPLLLLTLGPSERLGLVLVVFGCLWPILVQTTYGVRDADPVALDTGRSFGLSTSQRVVRIVLPGAAPFVVTGMRIAAGSAFVIAVVSELIGGAPGLGKDILLAQNAGLVAKTYALVLATGLLGLLLYQLIATVERRALHWHPSIRGELAL